jgi:hypothetical protein
MSKINPNIKKGVGAFIFASNVRPLLWVWERGIATREQFEREIGNFINQLSNGNKKGMERI